MPEETSREVIWRHIRAIRTCMMITHDQGQVRARPMRGIPRPEQNAIWFFSDGETHKDIELRENPDACLAFADLKANTFVSVSGKISHVRDQDTAQTLWSDGADSYFPEGPDDPRLVLLRFDPVEGEYWDLPSSPIILAIKFLEARITGERPALGSNGSTKL